MHPTRARLLEHGLALASEQGLRGLVVRELAARAEVNLGSFVYHFGSRERFIAELVEIWYAPLYQELTELSRDVRPTHAIDALRATLERLLDIAHEHAGFISHLASDALAGESAARAFLATVPPRHPQLVLKLIAQAQAERALVAGPPMHLALFMMAACGAPLVLGGGPLTRLQALPGAMAPLKKLLTDPAAAKQRLGWALKGLTP